MDSRYEGSVPRELIVGEAHDDCRLYGQGAEGDHSNRLSNIVDSQFFKVEHKDPRTQARSGRIRTAHGEIETPVFMPVGTAGTVKALTQEMLERLDARIILGNTHHLFLRPGHETVFDLGGCASSFRGTARF